MSLREAIQSKFGVTAKIKTGSPGDLSVLVDGKAIFGYKKEGQIPPLAEMLQRIQTAAG